MTEATLVLEGGATRGVFTSGALDYLMEKDLYLSDVIGVSAGACNAVDYLSKQIGRSRDCWIHKEKEHDYYYGIRKFIKEKSLMNMNMVFDDYPNKIYPFDYQTYFASELNCEIVTTNCLTGEAEYMTEKEHKQRLMDICRASCSMPLVSPIVTIDDTPYLDGGLADSIPLKRALGKGHKKVVIMLTRAKGYRKKYPSKAQAKLYRRVYKDYPRLADCIIRRPLHYNRTMDMLEKLEDTGKIFVLRPEVKPIKRLEKDYGTLMDFYQHGYDLMKRDYNRLVSYLEE